MTRDIRRWLKSDMVLNSGSFSRICSIWGLVLEEDNVVILWTRPLIRNLVVVSSKLKLFVVVVCLMGEGLVAEKECVDLLTGRVVMVVLLILEAMLVKSGVFSVQGWKTW